MVAMVGPATTGWLVNGAPLPFAHGGDDMALCGLQTGNQPRSRDFLLNSDYLVNTRPVRAALACIPVRLFERARLGAAGATHRYPD